MFYQGLGSIY